MDANADKLAAVLDEDATADLGGDATAPARREAVELSSPPQISCATPIDAIPGAVLRERYVLEEVLGTGGTATVYRARDLRRDPNASGGQRVALKILKPERLSRAQAVERLRREFEYAETLSHPNIARVFDFDCDSDLWFLTLELLEGESLAALLKRHGDEPIAAHRALDMLRACGEALAFAHERGIVHGDFKPGNVFITRTGQVRVLDFGAASASWQADDPQARGATPAYASPQVLEGQRPERRDDVFSFACVTYELLNGRHPFGRRSALEARAAHAELGRAWNLSTRQWHALEAALSWRREERPASIRSLVNELTSAEVSEPLVVPEIPAEAREFRSPVAAPIATIVALATLAVIALVAHKQFSERWRAEAGSPEIARPAPAGTPATEPEISVAAPGPAKAPDTTPMSGGADSARKATGESVSPQAPTRLASAASIAPPDETSVSRAKSGRPPLVSFETPSVLVSEGALAVVLQINRRQQLAGRTHVLWRTQSASALPGEDFEQVYTGTADFADGQTTRAIYVPLFDDRIRESDEKFIIELYAPDGDTRIHPTARAEAIIRDDD